MPDHFDTAYALRMSILGYLNAHGVCSSRQIADGVSADIHKVGRALRFMATVSEIQVLGQGKRMRYLALTTVSQSAQVGRDEMHRRRASTVEWQAEQDAAKEAKLAQATKEAGRSTGRTFHIVTNKDKPIQNQGGQGSSTIRRVSSLEYV